jgi:hypothetical protein
MSKSKLAKLKGVSPSLEKEAAKAKNPADATRMHALADIQRWPSNLPVDDSQMRRADPTPAL